MVDQSQDSLTPEASASDDRLRYQRPAVFQAALAKKKPKAVRPRTESSRSGLSRLIHFLGRRRRPQQEVPQSPTNQNPEAESKTPFQARH